MSAKEPTSAPEGTFRPEGPPPPPLTVIDDRINLPTAPIYRDFDTGNPSADSYRFDHALDAWERVCKCIIGRAAK